MQMLLCYAISEFNTSHSANGTRQIDSVSNGNGNGNGYVNGNVNDVATRTTLRTQALQLNVSLALESKPLYC